jgi:hypothetical protein
MQPAKKLEPARRLLKGRLGNFRVYAGRFLFVHALVLQKSKNKKNNNNIKYINKNTTSTTWRVFPTNSNSVWCSEIKRIGELGLVIFIAKEIGFLFTKWGASWQPLGQI